MIEEFKAEFRALLEKYTAHIRYYEEKDEMQFNLREGSFVTYGDMIIPQDFNSPNNKTNENSNNLHP